LIILAEYNANNMLAIIKRNGEEFNVDLGKPLDISIPLRDDQQPNCFWAPPFETSPVKMDGFIGSTAEGGFVNFKNVRINPHGNGTHTECVGHIAKDAYSINDCLQEFWFKAKVISILPQKIGNGDKVITKSQIEACEIKDCNALVLRTLPNLKDKMQMNYSGTNPTYMEPEAAAYLVELGIEHLLIDLPSVDREEDDAALLAHRAFWQYPKNIRENCTISELIFVPNTVEDGDYFLNLQIASFTIDVSPSKPVLYAVL